MPLPRRHVKLALHEWAIGTSGRLATTSLWQPRSAWKRADLTIPVIDVSAGDNIPRKGGSGIIRSDLLVIKQIDLAPMIGADLDIKDRDARRLRGSRPFVFVNIRAVTGVAAITTFVDRAGTLG